MNRTCAFFAVLLVACAVTAPVTATSFTGLGDLPGGAFSSFASGVSGDGSVVVGTSKATTGDRAFRWSASGGMQALGTLGAYSSNANGVSFDGSVIVGTVNNLQFSDFQGFQWTAPGGMVGLRSLGLTGDSRASGVSTDGNFVVGEGRYGVSSSFAFRGTTAGVFSNLGDHPGGSDFGRAFGVSGDGSVVAGTGSDFAGGFSFSWTAATGLIHLSGHPSSFGSTANAVSADGNFIVGQVELAAGRFAYEWTSAGGMISLGDLPGGSVTSNAFAVSTDGRVVVGSSSSTSGTNAFLWTQANGMQSLQDLLTSLGQGSAMSGWRLESATGISADGKTIVGYGVNPSGVREAWIATVPEPSALALAGIGGSAIALISLRRGNCSRESRDLRDALIARGNF